jgi:hypothetical protein
MGKIAQLLLTATLVVAICPVGSQPEGSAAYAVVLARPGKVSFVRSASGVDAQGNVNVGSVFRVAVDSVEVVYGDIEVPEKLSVLMIATHQENLTSQPEIMIVLRKNANGYEVHSWAEPMRVGCVDQAVTRALGIDEDWFVLSRRDGERCLPL